MWLPLVYAILRLTLFGDKVSTVPKTQRKALRAIPLLKGARGMFFSYCAEVVSNFAGRSQESMNFIPSSTRMSPVFSPRLVRET